MEKFVIRKATPSDAAAMLEYIKRIGGETDNLTFGGEGLPFSIESEEEWLEQKLHDTHSVCLVAEREGKIIADGSLEGLPRRMSHRAELGICVLKEAWNQGVGSAMMEKLIQFAKENQIEIVNLDVRADNVSAIHLYEKFGFKRIGVSPAFFKIEDDYFDFIHIYLDLR